MREPNDQLNYARNRIRSSTSGHPLTRAELAESVNAWVFRERRRSVQLCGNYIGKLERGLVRWPGDDCRAGLRAVLGIETDAELGFRPPSRAGAERGTECAAPPVPPAPPAPIGGGLAEVRRRTFLDDIPLAGVGAALGVEAARHGLNQAVAEGESADITDWYEIVREHADCYGMDTSRRLPEMLLPDILILQLALAQAPCADRRRELYKVGALLSQYMAQAVGDLGQFREAARWWRTARFAADSSGDPHIMLYIRGRAAIRDIYDGRPPLSIVGAIGTADELIATGPVVGRPGLLAARAQSYALLGRAAEAETALRALRDTFAGLPPDMTADHGWHCWAYPEERVRFAESFVYSHLGDIEAADAAQQAALRLYPPGFLRGPTQIELQRALCRVRSGDCAEGARHATATVERLPAEGYRTRFVMGLTEQVFDAIPPEERGRTAVTELRELIRSAAIDRRRTAIQPIAAGRVGRGSA
ncbi:hypothetical protein [Nocardia sp. BMG51109]|uniref:hypothetical protein n=1 Tax=Nocardia sp. BMG51109 TaxID=1056816 RepID=UPI0004630681|nr:hypothetical protein [Nocardia sp. BMG51109]